VAGPTCAPEQGAAVRAAGLPGALTDRFCLARRDVSGLLLGFAAFDPQQISAAARRLAAALRSVEDTEAPRSGRE
jgi:hypothetical protein